MQNAKHIFVTGASGFIGREVCEQLLKADYHVTVLLRKGSVLPHYLKEQPNLNAVKGDVTKLESLKGRMENQDAVIHLVGIIREFPSKKITFDKLHVEATGNVITAAKQSGIERFLHMSALGTSKNARNKYHQTKWLAEELVRDSKLNYTIFRPSIVFGRYDQFTNMIADMVRKFHLFPLIGGGTARLQPVAVKDVAEGFVNAINRYPSYSRTYDIGGLDIFTFTEMVREITRACNSWCVMPYAPVSAVRFFAKKLGNHPWFPITKTQLQMLTEDNITENRTFFEDLKIAPVSFEKGIRQYL